MKGEDDNEVQTATDQVAEKPQLEQTNSIPAITGYLYFVESCESIYFNYY